MREWLIKRADGMEYLLALVLLTICMLYNGYAKGMAVDSSRMVMVDSVRAELEYLGIQHGNIVLKQAVWESGWFECNNCSRRYNNIFGFRSKKWVTEENPQGYLKFCSWQESVAYYRWWQDEYYSGGDYYTFLVSIGYAEDGAYIANIKSIVSV